MSSKESPVKHQVILLMGKTGAGKSTLGNLLLLGRRNGPFTVSSRLTSETKTCQVETLSFHGNTYDIVDTPGMYDTRNGIDSLKEIADFVHKCAHGVRAILLVLKSERFTDEQRNTLNDIRTFLGKNARNNIVVVFSHANPEQIESRGIMEEAWNDVPLFSSFIRDIESRWSVSPNPYYLNADSEERLMENKNLISNIQDIYTTRQFEENQKRIAEEQRKKKEDDERRKKEYEDRIRAEAAEKARQEAEKKAKQEREKMRREMEENARQERDKLRREMEENAKPVYITRTEYVPRYRYIERENKETEKKVTSNVAVVSKKEDTNVVANVPKKEVAYVPKKEVANVPKKEVTNVPKKEVTDTEPGILGMVIVGATAGTFAEPGLGTIVGGIAGLTVGIVKKLTK